MTKKWVFSEGSPSPHCEEGKYTKHGYHGNSRKPRAQGSPIFPYSSAVKLPFLFWTWTEHAYLYFLSLLLPTPSLPLTYSGKPKHSPELQRWQMKPKFPPYPHRAGPHSERSVALLVPRAQIQEEAAAETSHSVKSPESQQHQPQQGTNPPTVCPQVDLASVILATSPESVPSRGLYHFVTQEIQGLTL